jgi:methylenetetrahydrofolate dehydrogenase (NADP+)/methenyltetrahydrofolate cyclohydrolase
MSQHLSACARAVPVRVYAWIVRGVACSADNIIAARQAAVDADMARSRERLKAQQEAAVVRAIRPDKDVDGFHPENVARLALEDPAAFVPCTPLGCQRLLIEYGIETAGARVVIIGRSMIVGKPLALLLMARGKGGDATVTIAHSRTRNLPAVCRDADILIAAIGRPEFVTADFVKDGAVVIDVGINRVTDPSAKNGYRIVGDVNFADVSPRCAAITPVPGGVGPMTIAMLISNTLKAARLQHGLAS